jgi:hypothetical protein
MRGRETDFPIGAADPSDIGAFSFEAVVLEAYLLPYLVKESFFHGSHSVSFLSVHFVILLGYGPISGQNVGISAQIPIA